MKRQMTQWTAMLLLVAGSLGAGACSDDGNTSGQGDAGQHQADTGEADDASSPQDADEADAPDAEAPDAAEDATESPTDAGSEDADAADVVDADAGDADAAEADAADTGPIGPVGWQAPNCTQITGNEGVTWSTDEGATFTPTYYPLGGLRYTTGLAVMSNPGHMLSATNQKLYRSTDAGCTWTMIDQLDPDIGLYTITPGSEDRAYVWSQNRTILYRVDGDAVTQLTLPQVPSSNPATPTVPIKVAGVGTDPLKPESVRVSTPHGQLYESTDNGQSWTTLNSPPNAGNAFGFVAAFDPSDYDHVILGVATDGAWTSFDAGQSWQKATGMSGGRDPSAFVYNLAYSPVDSNVVWANGMDSAEHNDPNFSGDGRYMFRSTDGGLSWHKALSEASGTDVVLINGQTMAAHPTDTNVLYFVFGRCASAAGVNIYRYDDATGQITTATSNVYDEISAFAFNPADPNVMYVGASTERDSHHCPPVNN